MSSTFLLSEPPTLVIRKFQLTHKIAVFGLPRPSVFLSFKHDTNRPPRELTNNQDIEIGRMNLGVSVVENKYTLFTRKKNKRRLLDSS